MEKKGSAWRIWGGGGRVGYSREIGCRACVDSMEKKIFGKEKVGREEKEWGWSGWMK